MTRKKKIKAGTPRHKIFEKLISLNFFINIGSLDQALKINNDYVTKVFKRESDTRSG